MRDYTPRSQSPLTDRRYPRMGFIRGSTNFYILDWPWHVGVEKVSLAINLMQAASSAVRTATVTRKTNETDIQVSLPTKSRPVACVREKYAHNNSPTRQVELTLDGTGVFEVNTGIGFLDHMLSALAKHGRFDLKLSCKVSFGWDRFTYVDFERLHSG